MDGRRSNYLNAIRAIAWKDLAAELRSRELLTSMLVFSTLIIMIFYFALDLDAKARDNIAAGVLWVTFAFAGTIGLNRAMAIEKDRGCLDGLLLAPVDRSVIYFGKMISSLVFMLIVELITLPIYSIFLISIFSTSVLSASFCLALSAIPPSARCCPPCRFRPTPVICSCRFCSSP